MTKNLNCQMVISEEAYRTAGVDPEALARTEVTIRGRDEPMVVRIAADPAVLATLVQQAPDAAKRQPSVAQVGA